MASNVVMISVDDLFNVSKFRDAFGIEIQTPNIDALMARGVTFDNAYANVALCNPSRTAIMSGQSALTTGVHNNQQPWEEHVNPADTFPAIMKAAGYHTAAFGKNFHWISPEARPIIYNQYHFTGQQNDHRDEIAVSLANTFLANYAGAEPFLLQVGIRDPHTPYNAPADINALYPLDQIVVPTWEGDDPPAFVKAMLGITGEPPANLAEIIQGYLAGVTSADRSIGKVLDQLEATGHDDATIVLFSDHGYSLGDHDHVAKFDLWERAANAPLIVVRPGGPAGVTVETPVSLLDIAPSVLGWAGLPVPARFEGHTLDAFLGVGGAYEGGPVMTTMYGSTSIRDGDWRFTRYEDGSIELFNVADDPACAHNLHGHSAETATELALTVTLDAMLADLGVTFTPDLTQQHSVDGDSQYFVHDMAALAGIADNIGHDTVYSFDLTTKIPLWVEDLVMTNRAGALIAGSGGDEHISAGNANDTVRAGGGKDVVNGNNGNDWISGGTRRDILLGGDGDDRINGNEGNDKLSGGKGTDTFVFRASESQGTDTILDYGAPDHIRFFRVVPASVTVADQGADSWITYGSEKIVVVGAVGLTISDLEFG